MAMLENSTGLPILRPEVVAALVTIPWQQASFWLRNTTLIAAQSPTVRLPILTQDLAAAFVPENTQITPSDPDLVELKVSPKKLATITRISHEMAVDSTPEVQGVVGASISRSLARATDAAAFAVSTTNADPGLYSLVGNTTGPTGAAAQEVTVTGDFVSIDPFVQAASLLEQHGATLNHYFADARTVLALSTLKTFTGTAAESNVPLLGSLPSRLGNGQTDSSVSGPQVREIQGVPIHSLPASAGIRVGDVWGIDSSRVYSVIREGVSLATSSELWFDFDAIAIRATTRWSPAFPDPMATVLISSTPS